MLLDGCFLGSCSFLRWHTVSVTDTRCWEHEPCCPTNVSLSALQRQCVLPHIRSFIEWKVRAWQTDCCCIASLPSGSIRAVEHIANDNGLVLISDETEGGHPVHVR